MAFDTEKLRDFLELYIIQNVLREDSVAYRLMTQKRVDGFKHEFRGMKLPPIDPEHMIIDDIDDAPAEGDFFGRGLEDIVELQRSRNAVMGPQSRGLAALRGSPLPRYCPECGCREGYPHRTGCKENFRDCIRRVGITEAVKRLLDTTSFWHDHAVNLRAVFDEPEFQAGFKHFILAEPALALSFLEVGIVRAPTPGWTCGSYHFNPDTNAEFLNDGDRDKCEICSRPKPTE